MPLAEDLVRITDIVTHRDPSFAHVPKPKIDAHIHNLEELANAEETEPFLLSAMRLMALPGNGHTRLIPNDAIKAYPLRFVTTGTRILLTNSPWDQSGAPFHELVAINDQPIHALTQRADNYLAGTSQRKRVIGPLLYAWPAALAELGAPSINGSHTFHFAGPDDETTVIELSEPDVRPAFEFYPRNEHGQPEPLWEIRDFARVVSYPETGMVIALPSFFDPAETELCKAIANAAQQVKLHRGNLPILMDVRGNTGGDFLMTMPLIDAICQKEVRCTVLVDKFTFSAAIVFVAILKHRLGQKIKVIGEEMGDGLRFYAEGDLEKLPFSGAHVRYSSALHDWETGKPDNTTPATIARTLLPAGQVLPDVYWVQDPQDDIRQEDTYCRFLKSLG